MNEWANACVDASFACIPRIISIGTCEKKKCRVDCSQPSSEHMCRRLPGFTISISIRESDVCTYSATHTSRLGLFSIFRIIRIPDKRFLVEKRPKITAHNGRGRFIDVMSRHRHTSRHYCVCIVVVWTMPFTVHSGAIRKRTSTSSMRWDTETHVWTMYTIYDCCTHEPPNSIS